MGAHSLGQGRTCSYKVRTIATDDILDGCNRFLSNLGGNFAHSSTSRDVVGAVAQRADPWRKRVERLSVMDL